MIGEVDWDYRTIKLYGPYFFLKETTTTTTQYTSGHEIEADGTKKSKARLGETKDTSSKHTSHLVPCPGLKLQIYITVPHLNDSMSKLDRSTLNLTPNSRALMPDTLPHLLANALPKLARIPTNLLQDPKRHQKN